MNLTCIIVYQYIYIYIYIYIFIYIYIYLYIYIYIYLFILHCMMFGATGHTLSVCTHLEENLHQITKKHSWNVPH